MKENFWLQVKNILNSVDLFEKAKKELHAELKRKNIKFYEIPMVDLSKPTHKTRTYD